MGVEFAEYKINPAGVRFAFLTGDGDRVLGHVSIDALEVLTEGFVVSGEGAVDAYNAHRETIHGAVLSKEGGDPEAIRWLKAEDFN